MGWNDVKLDAADIVFSLFIRARDKRCVKCGRRGLPNADGLPVLGLQASHYWSRRHESTRFDPFNVDALCAGCHRLWGGAEREGYKAFKIKQLGQKAYDWLEFRHNQYQKKDRKMALIAAKFLLKNLPI